jgi:hypothetical protein
MYNTAVSTLCVLNNVKCRAKLLKNKPLVSILRNKDNGFITFTINTLQP